MSIISLVVHHCTSLQASDPVPHQHGSVLCTSLRPRNVARVSLGASMAQGSCVAQSYLDLADRISLGSCPKGVFEITHSPLKSRIALNPKLGFLCSLSLQPLLASGTDTLVPLLVFYSLMYFCLQATLPEFVYEHDKLLEDQPLMDYFINSSKEMAEAGMPNPIH